MSVPLRPRALLSMRPAQGGCKRPLPASAPLLLGRPSPGGAWASGQRPSLGRPLTPAGAHVVWATRTRVALCHAEQSVLVNNASFWEEKSKASCVAGGNVRCCSCFERPVGPDCQTWSRHVSQQVRWEVHTGETEATFTQQLTQTGTAAPLTTPAMGTAQGSTETRVDRRNVVHPHKGAYSATKRSEAGTHATTRMSLEDTMLRERSQMPPKPPHVV